MRQINLFLIPLLLLSVMVVGCGKKKQKAGISLEVEWSLQDSDTAFFYTYGTHDVTIDTLLAKRKGRLKIYERVDRDTLDLLLLRGSLGELLLPIMPRGNEDIRVIQKKDTLIASGIKYADQIREYHRLLDECEVDVSESMLEYIENQKSEVITLFLVQDLIHRFPNSSCMEELRGAESSALRVSAEYARVLGIEGSILGYELREKFPESVTFSGEEEQVRLRKRLGKKYWMAVSILDLSTADTLQLSRLKKYFNRLDSLGVPSLHILPSVDSLPKSWSVKKGETWRAFLLDSAGMASNFMEAYQMLDFPIYLLVDSTMQVWRGWEQSDSLVQFIKSYNASMKESEKDGDRISK